MIPHRNPHLQDFVEAAGIEPALGSSPNPAMSREEFCRHLDFWLETPRNYVRAIYGFLPPWKVRIASDRSAELAGPIAQEAIS